MKLAIITARGGSKRIPKKNIKDFCGKPIIAYSIKAALESNIFDDVMVSTDSNEIADVACKYGASVPFMRSESTSNDYATTSDVIKEVLEKYIEAGIFIDSFCCIYPTAPFVTAKRLIAASEILDSRDVYSVVPVVKFSFPPQRGFIIDSDILNMPYPEYKNIRSQDIQSMYHDAGQFYFVKTTAFNREHSVVTSKSAPLILNENEVQDIDTMDDWKMAEIKYKIKIGEYESV